MSPLRELSKKRIGAIVLLYIHLISNMYGSFVHLSEAVSIAGAEDIIHVNGFIFLSQGHHHKEDQFIALSSFGNSLPIKVSLQPLNESFSFIVCKSEEALTWNFSVIVPVSSSNVKTVDIAVMDQQETAVLRSKRMLKKSVLIVALGLDGPHKNSIDKFLTQISFRVKQYLRIWRLNKITDSLQSLYYANTGKCPQKMKTTHLPLRDLQLAIPSGSTLFGSATSGTDYVLLGVWFLLAGALTLAYGKQISRMVRTSSEQDIAQFLHREAQNSKEFAGEVDDVPSTRTGSPEEEWNFNFA